MVGYLLAYHGKIQERDVQGAPDLRHWQGRPVVYVSDLAANQPGAGVALLKQLLTQYKEHYLRAGQFPPIYLQARAQTSYKIFSGKLFERWKKDLEAEGLTVDMHALPTYKSGEDTMHPLMICPRRLTDAPEAIDTPSRLQTPKIPRSPFPKPKARRVERTFEAD